MAEMKVWFDHGLGDCVQFVHLLELYRRRGFDVRVHFEANKAAVWELTGFPYSDIDGCTYHPWIYDAQFNSPSVADTGHGNKIHGNLTDGVNPLPSAGDRDALWEELCHVSLVREVDFTSEVRDTVARFVEDLPRPIVLLHSKGTNMQDSKSIEDAEVERLYGILLDGMGGSLVLLDWDYRVPRLPHGRVRHIKDDLGHIDLYTLLALYKESSLLVGVDSGPYHLAMLTDLPTLGVFHHHYPACVALPRKLSLNMTRGAYREWNIARRRRWNIVEYADTMPDPEAIALQSLRMLQGCRYLSAECDIARDVQMQQMIREWLRQSTGLSSYADRNNTMDWLLREIKARFGGKAVIVETGCSRSSEDWSAGYSTYLFSMLADSEPGIQFISIDNDAAHVETAKSLVSCWRGKSSFVVGDSVVALAGMGTPIDVLFLDSWDSDIAGHAEHGLAEIIAASRALHERSVVVYDDTVWYEGGWKGKGALAVPFMLSRGWRIAAAGYQVCLVRKES